MPKLLGSLPFRSHHCFLCGCESCHPQDCVFDLHRSSWLSIGLQTLTKTFEMLPKLRFHVGQRAGRNLSFQSLQTTSPGRFHAMKTVFQKILAPIKSDSDRREFLATF